MYDVDRLEKMAADARLFALSLAYAQRAGYTVELHTDTLGSSILGHLPYDDIHLTLDTIPDSISPRFWAAGKIYTLAASDPDALHIDGDVFIKDPAVIGHAAGASLFVQQVEPDSSWLWREGHLPEGWTTLCDSFGISPALKQSFNTGVMRITDPDLRSEFIGNYICFVEEASKRWPDFLESAGFFTPDLFIEQLSLLSLASRAGIEPVTVFASGTNRPPKGYQHLISSAKYGREVQYKIMATLENYFPYIHMLTKKKWQNL